jgi:RimK family alpha-L-glutamate ligase
LKSSSKLFPSESAAAPPEAGLLTFAFVWCPNGEQAVRDVAQSVFLGNMRVMAPMFALVAHRQSWTNAALLARPWPGRPSVRLSPYEALKRLGPGDIALGRLDVRTTLDGVEDGLRTLDVLAAQGVTVLNGAQPLLRAHDKLATARALARAGLPHPRTRLVLPGRPFPAVAPPVVVKPRFGSWGRDVVLCSTEDALAAMLSALHDRPWFVVHGAIVQELVPPRGFDVRIVVAAGEVVGAIERRAAPGEWRTNVALGGTRNPYVPDQVTIELARAAAVASGLDLVGVDLLPSDGGWVVLELNGAADFTAEYAPGGDPFAAAIAALARAVAAPADLLPAADLAVAEPV